MRLFIAIDFKEQEDYFKELQEQIPEAKLRKVNTFHLTLKFLGDIEEPHLDKIKQALSKIKLQPFKIKLDNIGFFPSQAYIRVIWAGFKSNEELTELQKQVEDVLKNFEFRKDFEFVPHLTLARVSFIKNKEKFLETIKKIKIEPKEVEINNFKLIKSDLTEKGPIYTDLEIFNS